MAGTKKKKKPAANPARGFATTSVASKPRPEATEGDQKTAQDTAAKGTDPSDDKTASQTVYSTAKGSGTQGSAKKEEALTAEEFEKQLEESELQLLVEKYAAKVKRDSQRQRTRLETDKRLLRGSSDPINAPRWLPEELMEHVLDLIKAESRFSASNISVDSTVSGKLPPEEELISRLWALQQTLSATGVSNERIQAVVQHVTDISPSIPPANKDYIWGLEEAFEWLARECELNELPPYESRPKPLAKGI